MKLKIKDTKGKDQGELEVKFKLVEDGKGTQAVHDTVVAYNAAQRMGTASTKTMGEVAGSGKKPWRQKGTGRARAGSFASPLWRGGGVVFGPKPRDFAKKVSRKTRQLALRKALSAEAVDDDEIRDEIRVSRGRYGTLVCPHTATATRALARLRERGDKRDFAVVATAHPAKFEAIIEPLIGAPVEIPPALAALLDRPAASEPLGVDYGALREHLLAPTA